MARHGRGPGLHRASLKGVVPAVCLALFAIGARAGPEGVPATENSTLADDGQEIFNATCAHCHGPDAVQAQSRIDLRLLRRKYGSGMEETYFKTVADGRVSKGMPAWKYVFTPGQILAVFAYLKTVQAD